MKILNLREKNLEKFLKFNEKVFEENVENIFNKIVMENPLNTLEDNCFYLEKDNEIISGLIMSRKVQEFRGKSTVVGEYDLVGTLKKYRKKGFCRNIMEHTFNIVKDEGGFLCRLIGIPNFYQNLSFEYASPAYFTTYMKVDKDSIHKCKRVYEIREIQEFTEEILGFMIELFVIDNRKNIIAEKRNIESFRYNINEKSRGKNDKWIGVYHGAKLKGYLWFTVEEEKIFIKESIHIDCDACETSAAYIYELMKERKISTAELRCPLNNRFAEFLYKNGGYTRCDNRLFHGAWGEMYKILDLKKALDYIKEELEERLQESPFKRTNMTLLLTIGDTGVIINLEEGSLSFTEKPDLIESLNPMKVSAILEYSEKIETTDRNFVSIYTGYKSASDLREYISYSSEDVRRIFEILFTKGHPYIWTLDINDSFEE